jgi:hypothetical protein
MTWDRDLLVVVRTVGLALEETGLLGVLEITDVPEVGDGVAVGAGTDTIVLVVLVIEDEELLPGGVGDPALVGVGGTLVGGAADDVGGGLVGDIVAV